MKSTRENAVARGEIALAAYRKECIWGSDDELLSDLLADLMHLVDELKLDREVGRDFNDLLGSAEINYEAEKAEDKQ